MALRRLVPSRLWLFAVPAIGGGIAASLAVAAGSVSGASSPSPVTPRHAEVSAPHPAPTDPAHGLHRFTALVGPDLSDSLHRAGVPSAAARDYVAQMLRVDGFASQISVADRFDLIVAELPGQGSVLVYAGMDRIGRGDLQYLKYGDERGRTLWVDARGLERRESAGLMLPVGGRVTSGFGTRMHPLLGRLRLHRGVDLAATAGTPIRAAADGRVAFAEWRGGYGWQVALAHEAGLATSYSHMSRMLARPGAMVRRGQVIGLVGSSGLSTGPHVHFEATRKGRSIDPRGARLDVPVAMDKAQRTAFNGQLRALLMLGGG